MRSDHYYRQVDLSTWKRREHYEVFGHGEYPYIGLTTSVDITRLLAACAEKDRKFFNAFLYVVTRAMNGIENFRYRIYEDEVVLLDGVDPSFNVMDKEKELFYFAYAAYDPDFATFDARVEEAKATALAKGRLADGNNRLDVAYISCLPWFGFSDIIQPLGLSANDSIPRLVWGKYEDNGKIVTMPFSLTGHHGLFDGFHINKLLEAMKKLLEKPDFL